MTPEDWQKLQDLFNQVTELPPAEVPPFLDRACSGNSALRAELESMLQQDHGGSTRIQEAIDSAAKEINSGGSDPWTGKLVGVYRVLSKIAEGGMGAVYKGERADEHYRQTVAIKILNFGQMSSAMRARFVDERQILANLHHPNIATLIDGGATEQGIPYLVMEYIDGIAIDQFCNEQRLSIRARLNLFLEVCAAVQYAHQNLVVHRDIKPGNILVDDRGTPKLLDFGIAKLVDPDALEQSASALTRVDMRVLTPEFASPEQVRGEKVTTATDVYALGLLLYRLLTGKTPYHFASYSPLDIEHAVCETRPDRPSSAAEHAVGDALQRGLDTSPSRWASQLKGDLDNITLLSLRKEPRQRYGTVQQLADDLQRHLDQRPVQARPTSVVYRASKFVGRHRRGVAAAVFATVVLAGLVSYYTLQLASERDRAQLESRKATEVAAFLAGMFRLSDPAEMSGESISARELLDRGARRIEYELANQPEVQATMTQVIGRNYRNLGLYMEAESLFRNSLEVRRALYGENHADTLASWNDLGLTLIDLGKFEEADRQLRRVIAIQKQSTIPNLLDLAINQRSLSIALLELGDYEAAEQRLRAAMRIQRESSPEGSVELATTLAVLGRLYVVKGDFQSAKSRLNESVAMQTAIHGREHPDTLKALNQLGTQYLNHGEILAAREIYNEVLILRRKIFDKRHVSVGRVLGNLGTINYQVGDFDTAMEQYVESLDILRQALGEAHPKIALMKENIANVYLATGEQDQAYRMYLESIAQMRQIFGDVHIETGMTTSNVGGALIVMQRYEEARPYLLEADAIFREVLGDEHPAVASNMLKLGQSEQELQQYSVAESTYRQALAVASKSLAPEHQDILKIQYAIGDVMMLRGMLAESEAMLRKTLVAWHRIDPGTSAHPARTAGLLGDCLVRMQRYREAESYLLESHDKLAAIQENDHQHMVEARERLARLYLAWNRPEDAKDFL